MLPKELLWHFSGRLKLDEFAENITVLMGLPSVWRVCVSARRRIYLTYDGTKCTVGDIRWWNNNIPAVYFTDDGKYSTTISITENTITFGEWKETKGLSDLTSDSFVLNSTASIRRILKNKNPYAFEYAEENDYPMEHFIVAPELELLLKAGYSFAEKMLHLNHDNNAIITAYNRLIDPKGKNLKSLFKTGKAVYSTLKNEPDLRVWDTFRKMYKKGRLTAQEIPEVYDRGYSSADISKIDEILRKKDEKGKPYFNFNSLLRYLDRIDMYEAIPFSDGIWILSDYLRMCNQLEIKPNLTSDSLKREHDVTARIVRNKRNEYLDELMKEPCEESSKYNYKESNFLIRSITGYDDLVDEATQQRNCVASYGHAIADRKTMIFVMRTVKEPEKSLATVELKFNGEIRQVRLAYNRPMHNKAQSDFLKRWRKEVLSIMHGKKDVEVEEKDGQLMLVM